MISFSLKHASTVRLSVHDLLGREVQRIVDGSIKKGSHKREIRLARQEGITANGVFLIMLDAGGARWSRKVSVVR